MNPPNFRSADPYAAYWNYNDGAYSNICATSARSFLDRAKAVLGLATGGSWDDAFQARLITKVQSFVAGDPAWGPILTVLQRDAASRNVSALSLQTAIFITYYRPNNRRFDAISIPANTTFPQWGNPPGGQSGVALLCFDPSADPDPGILSSSQIAAAASSSTTGVRTGAGRGPTSQSITQTGNGVISPLTVGIVAVLILGVGYALSRSAK